MNAYDFTLAGAALQALGTGALFWPAESLLCVSDLHLGKSGRHGHLGEATLPPYKTQETLARLETDIKATSAKTIICLGDSFDDPRAARDLPESEKLWIAALQAGRRWVWIEGNHDPGPVDLGGTHLAELPIPPLAFRHIARPGQSGEVSGHYHPKATVRIKDRNITRPAFLLDSDRVILPAYGIYTGRLHSNDDVLQRLMRREALAVLTGSVPHAVPMPR